MFTARYGLNINTQLWSFYFSPRKSGLNPRPVPVRFMVHTAALLHVSLPILQFPPSVLFHRCYTLIFIYMLLLPEEQTGEMLERSQKQCSFVNGEGLAVCSTDTQRCAVLAHSLQWVVDVSVLVPCFQFAVYVCLSLEAISPTERSRIEVLQ